MGYIIKCFSHKGEEIDFKDLDKDVCSLWNIPLETEKWATPVGMPYAHNWHERIVTLIYFSMPESGIATIDHLIQFHLKEKGEIGLMEYFSKDKYFMSLLLYLIKRKIFFTIQYYL